MRRFGFALIASLSCSLAVSASAQTAPAKPQPAVNSCFNSSQFQAFRAIDDHAFYMRANMNDYYRIDLAGSCPALTEADSHLITVVRGSNQICGPLDWDLRIGHSGPGAFSESCIVSGQARLSPAEAAAIPRKLKP